MNDTENGILAIESGVVKALIRSFSGQPFDQITRLSTYIFLRITYCLDEIMNSIIDLNPFPALFRTLSTSSDLPHPYFDQFAISGYIQQLYNLFKQTNDNDDKDIASPSIGRLFRAKEILDINMRKEIIEHLKTLLDDKDEWNQTAAKQILKDLQINQVNKSEIENDGFKLPI
ncbi:MAG: hypothetical protein EZS28_049464 [Streblomastix strix]|uniref:Uncharacterized protein n=1 Tax=Streblomastix strix TaxID=222440 RepID=A0A5J4TA02_9EUKA|nr:MAG: hypothetical protein EZS28_049464 [Streblomastix strix]